MQNHLLKNAKLYITEKKFSSQRPKLITIKYARKFFAKFQSDTRYSLARVLISFRRLNVMRPLVLSIKEIKDFLDPSRLHRNCLTLSCCVFSKVARNTKEKNRLFYQIQKDRCGWCHLFEASTIKLSCAIKIEDVQMD